MSSASESGVDIRPFQVEIPEQELAELRRRIKATRWPSKELVADRSQGVQLATLQALDTTVHGGTTVWIIDTADSPATAPARFPIVNGSTTDFIHPFAMTIHGNPAHKRFPQIKVQRLRGNPDHVRVSQLWGANVSN